MLSCSEYVMEQMIIAIVIIALGFYCFKFYPFKKGDTMKLVISAIFIMVTLIAKRFLTLAIPLFGLESLKIGIEYIPLMIAGYLLSPSYAFVIGLCSDLIGLILVPTGFPFFGFTLTMILVSVIPSLVKEHMISFSMKQVEMMTTILIGILVIGASLYIWNLDTVSIEKTVYELTVFHKSFLISTCLLLMILFMIFMYLLKKRINEEESKIFSTWIMCVILTEVVCTLCLTPLWLDMMYGIPFVVSLCIRVIKECLIIPIEIFIGYTLIKILSKVLKV